MRRRATYRPGRDPRAVFHPPAPGAASLGSDRHVVVVGGGIAGITAALALAERGARVSLVEREDRLGGRVRSWPVAATGQVADDAPAEDRPAGLQMSRGFHAFFRQYYNLRALLRRTDPALRRLVPLEDYPLVRAGGGRDSFTALPTTPPWNLVEFVRRSPSFTTASLAKVDVEAALGLLDVDFPDTFGAYDGISAADLLDRLRFPEQARHLALEVFARSFFADPRDFSGAELLAMFHMYFVGSAEGLLFDVPNDDYDSALWAPLARHLRSLGVQIRTGAAATRIEAGGSEMTVHLTDAGSITGDAVVVALDPVGLRALVAASPRLGGADSAGARWRDSVAAVRSAPPFAVWRLWLDRPVAPGRPPFLGTSGYGLLDNVSNLHLFEEHARTWAESTGGSVVELHAYALPTGSAPAGEGDSEGATLTTAPGVDEEAVRADLWEQLVGLQPEVAEATVLHEEWLLEADCVLVGPDRWASRPGVSTPDPRVVLAGDAVRVDLPVALMERAATTGWLAADTLLASWGVRGHGVWSVPLTSRFGPFPALARRALRTARRR